MSGRRRGELVESSPKTRASQATIALPDGLVAVLRDHQARQRVERLKAIAWVDPGLVFTTHVVTWLDHANVRK